MLDSTKKQPGGECKHGRSGRANEQLIGLVKLQLGGLHLVKGMVAGGTRGKLTTQSGATVEGGPGLVLVSVLDVPRNNVHWGVDSRRVLSDQRRHVGLLEPALLGKHVGELVLDNVRAGVDCRRVLSVLLRLVGLLEPALLGEHLVKLVLGPSFMLHSISLLRVHN